MSTIYLGVFLITIASLAGLAVFWITKHRKELRTQLRLLNGRSQLLTEEIDRQKNELLTIDESIISALRQEAEASLNTLNIAIVERQAHLLNYSDLTHLQRCKFEWLEPTQEIVSTQPEEIDPSSLPSNKARRPHRPAPTPPRQEEAAEREHKDRSQIEDQLLGKISQLNKDQNKRK
ncbi:MAG: hypothetical protein ACKVJG_04270 [Candidatus Latescibacterota bacterium]|jgi:hypothetical protein